MAPLARSSLKIEDNGIKHVKTIGVDNIPLPLGFLLLQSVIESTFQNEKFPRLVDLHCSLNIGQVEVFEELD